MLDQTTGNEKKKKGIDSELLWTAYLFCLANQNRI